MTVTALLKSGNPTRKRRLILIGFLGAQFLDVVTTHLGLSRGREELNGVANYFLSAHGELSVYALKLTLVGLLLALLLLLGQRKPRLWDAYLIAAWITTAAVVNNVLRIAL
jgi:hypothetical protein